jgi:hypothetical protein
MLRAIPLTILPVVGYLVVVMLGGVAALGRPVFTVPLPSGVAFPFDAGSLIIVVTLFALFLEMIKATLVKNANSILDHGLSTVLLIICILLFVLAPMMGTATFFLIVVIVFIDVMAGFTVSIKTAQRDFSVDKTFN